MGAPEIAAALRTISRGFADLAAAIEGDGGEMPSTEERYLAALTEWGAGGLNREQASALLRKHGFAPQAAGGWVRADWIETRDDGLRYLTDRSHRWLEDQLADQHEEQSDAG